MRAVGSSDDVFADGGAINKLPAWLWGFPAGDAAMTGSSTWFPPKGSGRLPMCGCPPAGCLAGDEDGAVHDPPFLTVKGRYCCCC